MENEWPGAGLVAHIVSGIVSGMRVAVVIAGGS